MATSADSALLAEITDSSRVENRSAARKVLAAGALWDAWIERDVELGSGKIADCGNAAIAELAVRLGCSKTVAESWAALGIDLRLRLPKTRVAFEAGDLDLARVRVISRETTGLSANTVSALEPHLLASARHLSPGPLAAEIERLASACAPAEVAEQRETVQAWQRRVVKRRGRGCATVEVTVSPEEGEAVMQLLGEFAKTVCDQDRRGAQEKLVESILALVHGEPYLACTCGRDDCDAPKADALPGRRAPLTQITLDVATLLGLVSEPAYLHGHGLIDPELARQLAASGTWQAMLTELHDLADELGLVDHVDQSPGPEAEARSWAEAVEGAGPVGAQRYAGTAGSVVDADIAGTVGRGVPGRAATSPSESVDIDANAADPAVGPQLSDSTANVADSTDVGRGVDGSNAVNEGGPGDVGTEHGEPLRYCVRSFLARGKRRAAGTVPEPAAPPPDSTGRNDGAHTATSRTASPSPIPTPRPSDSDSRRSRGVASPPRPQLSGAPAASSGVGTMADAILAAVRANPALANGVHRDGHGGLHAPPPGALTYRPSAETAALVRARDRHCRFPGCHRPAEQCQIDHIVEFDVRNPRAGGWTIVANLQCLCAFHHQMKTLRMWDVVTVGGHGIAGHALLWASTLGSAAVTLPGGATGAAGAGGLRPRLLGRRADRPSALVAPTDPEPPPF